MKLILLIFLIGCSSHLKNAQDYYDNKMYHKALNELEKGLAENEHNSEYNIALKKTQDKVYEMELLKIRDQRNSGNIFKALNQVRKTDKKFKEWNIKSNVNGSNFRKSELNSIMVDFQKYLDEYVSKNHILKAYKDLTSYEDILYNIGNYRDYKGYLISKGKEKCMTLKKGKFFNIFIKNYCNFFNAKRNVSTYIGDELYTLEQVYVVSNGRKIKGFNFLRNSKLYHGNGKKVTAYMDVNFKFNEIKGRDRKEKEYSEVKYYWDYEDKTHFVNQQYWGKELKCNYALQYNPCSYQKVRKTRVVPVTRRERVKKSKTVYKDYVYYIKTIEQFLYITGESHLNVGGSKVSVDYNYNLSHYDHGHDIRNSKVGLSPKRMKKKNYKSWKESEERNLINSLRYTVENNWKDRYCNTFNNENFARCFFLMDSHSSLDKWSLNFSGVNFKEMNSFFKLSKH